MLPYRDSRLTRITLIAFFLLVVGYAYFEGRGLLYGPTIEIEGRAMQVEDPFITIEGRAQRVLSLTMNGRAVPLTEAGDFSEPFVLAPGYNRILLEAKDRYGKSTERQIEIVYTGSLATSSHSSDTASSTESIAP
ncbi:MAG: hypothetical protein HYS26_00085 [Candidatus Kaiserbacteria bacterium]|nr:MAG: hypothetical protein HYS26_00085 [Candidatus Kaiserbacteria bacterium]